LDAASGKELRRHTADGKARLSSALLTPDGQSVVTLECAGQKYAIRVRDWPELKVTREFPVGDMQSPRLTPDGKLLIAQAGNAM